MALKIEEGKFYRTRDGRKVGPMKNYLLNKFDCEPEYPGEFWQSNGINANPQSSLEEKLDLVEECTDEPAAQKLWRDMTPEEKGALLLAHHEGKVIERFTHKGKWIEVVPAWHDDCAYRIRPEAKRETVRLRGGFYRSGMGCEFKGWDFANNYMCEGGSNHTPTHRITFDLIDGKPDLASIRMEEI